MSQPCNDALLTKIIWQWIVMWLVDNKLKKHVDWTTWLYFTYYIPQFLEELRKISEEKIPSGEGNILVIAGTEQLQNSIRKPYPLRHLDLYHRLEHIFVLSSIILTPWSRILLEKLTGLQLVKKFPAFYGTRRFITALTSVRHQSLSWDSPIQSTYPHPTSWRSILIIKYNTCPYPGPAQSSPHTHIHLLEIYPNIILSSTPRSPKWFLSHRFPHQ